MVHYPRYIRKFGPLGALWCMRYEGKHAYFKSLIRILGNFIDLPWTLAYRYQQWMCQRFHAAGNQFLTVGVTLSSKCRVTSITSLIYFGQLVKFFKISSSSEHHFGNLQRLSIEQKSWVKFNSVQFMVNQSVVL